MAKRPEVHKENFTVKKDDGTEETREITHADRPTATYRFGAMLPYNADPGRWQAQIWCKSKDDVEFAAQAMFPPGDGNIGHAIARYNPPRAS